jgi:hypothetical protein
MRHSLVQMQNHWKIHKTIGSNGSDATEMRKQNNFVIKQQHVTPCHAGQGGSLELTWTVNKCDSRAAVQSVLVEMLCF